MLECHVGGSSSSRNGNSAPFLHCGLPVIRARWDIADPRNQYNRKGAPVQKRVLIAFLVAVSLALLAIPADARKLPNADALARSARKAARDLSREERALVKPGREIQYEERFGVPTFLWTAPSSPDE